MTPDSNMQPMMEDATGELSPVKRALLEIRRLRAESEALRQGQSAPIAIVGMAMRLPGAITSPEALWQALFEGRDLIAEVPSEIPKARWQASLYRSPNPNQPGTMHPASGGFLADIDRFDAEFFGISPREAASMDPQHRILLELAWEALERAGIDPHSLFGTQAEVFLGLGNSDYGRLLIEHTEAIDAYTGIGAAISIAAGRLAYFFGTHGPAMAVDTACSSSLVAIHHAVQSLRRGETGLALVGGANLILSPEMNLCFSRSGMLSPEARCKSFSASADGYVRSEGCCVMVLKRLADAEQAGDKVLAVIHGSAVNQDGRSAGITAPNGPAQSAVMRAALKDASLDASAVSYVEAHGTGTPLGDPMELQALANVYGASRVDGTRLKVGSIKSNLGHTEAAAGMASLAKVVLMMQPGNGFVPNLHLGELNDRLDWKTLPIEIVTKAAPWDHHDGTVYETVYAGVSSFGFSGTNAHLIVGAAPQTAAPTDPVADTPAEGESILFISAAHPESLEQLAREYVDLLQRSSNSFHDVCQASIACRARLGKRIAIRASSAAEASEKLRGWLKGDLRPGVMTNLTETTNADSSSLEPADSLGQQQWDVVFGSFPMPVRPKRLVDLPLYPFRRTSYWFGPTTEIKSRQQREGAWRVMNEEASRQSLSGPLGWNIHGYTARWKTLEKLTRLHAQHVLATADAFAQPDQWMTVADVVRDCGFRPVYTNLLTRWLNSLTEDGVLERDGEQYRAAGEFVAPSLDPVWLETAQAMADDLAAFLYLERCGALLGDILTGRKPALETLFPEGSFEPARRLYEQSVEARYFNPIVASAVSAAVREMQGSRPLRVLEIGAGTGGTTAAVLKHLGTARLEYWFTDVSEIFLSRAKKQFGCFAGVHYALFDLERDPAEQGFSMGAFDLVISANAVHAVRNLDTALHTIQRLLAPGAALVLLETTRHHAWFDMSTGLIEGWQRFEDAYREDQPLLDPVQWHAVLTSNGFVDVAAYPGPDSPAADLGQHVLLAHTASAGSAEAFASGIPIAAAKGVRAEPRLVDFVPQQIQAGEIASPTDFALSVRQTVCRVFQLPVPPEELGDRERLSELGMDSLIALELRAELSRRLELRAEVPSTIAFETGTVGELVRALEALRGLADPAALQPQPLSSFPAAAPRVTATQLESMTDAQVEQLLEERLGRS